MRYFENTLRLRIDPKEKYKAHQAVDTLMQEKLQIRLPYSWRSVPYPGAEHYSAVQIRTSVPTGLPGEIERTLMLGHGDILQFRCNICSVVRERVYEGDKERRRDRTGSTEAVMVKMKQHGERNGLDVLSSVFEDDALFDIKKPKKPTFVLGHKELSVIARVKDPAMAERAVIEGLGNKRIFGFGYLWQLEVL